MVMQKGVLSPQDFAKALEAEKQSLSAFETMRPSCKKRYVAWIEDAKRTETRERRIKRAMEMAQDWKQRYQNDREKPKTI